MKKVVRFVSKLVFLLLLVTILFSYAMFQGGFVSWFLFFSFLPILLYQLLFLFYPIDRWQVNRDQSKEVVYAGETLSVTIKIKRTLPFPLYYCVIEEVISNSLDKTDYGPDKFHYLANPSSVKSRRKVKQVRFPWFKRRIHYTYELNAIPRGEHELQAVRIKTGDVFGFIKKDHTFPISTKMTAYPAKRSIDYKKGLHSVEQGVSKALIYNVNHTNIATGSRPYIAGDRLSWIDWKQTARKNTMMTKEFEQERNTNMVIVLDMTHEETANDLAFDGAIEVTAALLQAMQENHTSIQLLTLGKAVDSFSGEEDRMIQHHLASLTMSKQQLPSKELEYALQKGPKNSIMLFVTTEINEQVIQEIRKVIEQNTRLIIYLVQSEASITSEKRIMIEMFRRQGIGFVLLTERELMKRPIEVNMA